MSKHHFLEDRWGQDIINRGHERAWEKKTRPLDEINRAWAKEYGANNIYKRTPKYTPKRGSGGREGFGILLNALFDD